MKGGLKETAKEKEKRQMVRGREEEREGEREEQRIVGENLEKMSLKTFTVCLRIKYFKRRRTNHKTLTSQSVAREEWGFPPSLIGPHTIISEKKSASYLIPELKDGTICSRTRWNLEPDIPVRHKCSWMVRAKNTGGRC